MKKILFGFCTAMIIVSCSNNNGGADPVTEPVKTPDVVAKETPREVKELPLFAKYDCGSCHKFDEKFQGPSYIDIANKYAGKADSKDYLSKKITDGGSGVWGELPMAGHPSMPKADISTIVDYILALKK